MNQNCILLGHKLMLVLSYVNNILKTHYMQLFRDNTSTQPEPNSLYIFLFYQNTMSISQTFVLLNKRLDLCQVKYPQLKCKIFWVKFHTQSNCKCINILQIHFQKTRYLVICMLIMKNTKNKEVMLSVDYQISLATSMLQNRKYGNVYVTR